MIDITFAVRSCDTVPLRIFYFFTEYLRQRLLIAGASSSIHVLPLMRRLPQSTTQQCSDRGVGKPVVNVAKENVGNNVKGCTQEMPGIKETKRDIQNRIQHYYTQHPGTGYAEAGKALGISRQVVRMNVLKMSQPAVGDVGHPSNTIETEWTCCETLQTPGR